MADEERGSGGPFDVRYVQEVGEPYVHLRMRPGTPQEQEYLLGAEEAQGLGMSLVRLWYQEGGPPSEAPKRMSTLLRWLAVSMDQK